MENNVRIYLNENNEIIGYSAGETRGVSDKVVQDDPGFYFQKMKGYKIEYKDGENHLIFDEDLLNTNLDNDQKNKDIQNGLELLNKLNTQMTLNNATDADAYIMRYLYPEWSSESVSYKKDNRFMYNNKFYKVLQDHKSSPEWLPDKTPSLYVEISDPNVEYPEFKQPTGSHDAYNMGDKITFENKKYISLINGNAWSPKDYPSGWKLVE